MNRKNSDLQYNVLLDQWQNHSFGIILYAGDLSFVFRTFAFRTKLMKRIYDEYDLDVKMYEKPVGFKLGTKINGSK